MIDLRQNNPWSYSGEAVFPPNTPLVAQDKVYGNLKRFVNALLRGSDRARALLLIGDWGVGKSRIGFELVAESLYEESRWYVSDPSGVFGGIDQRILKHNLQDGILPLFIMYQDATRVDNLGEDNWVPVVTFQGLAYLAGVNIAPADSELQRIYSELVTVLNLKAGEDVQETLSQFFVGDELASQYHQLVVEKCKNWLEKKCSINQFLTIVEEVESEDDFQKRPDFGDRRTGGADEQNILIIPRVLKHTKGRVAYPYMHFVLLCSRAVGAKFDEISSTERRVDVVVMEKNRLEDVQLYVHQLKEQYSAVNYFPELLNSAFFATDRNFGWLNVLMHDVHMLNQLSLPVARQFQQVSGANERIRRYIFNFDQLKAIHNGPFSEGDVLDKVFHLGTQVLEKDKFQQYQEVKYEKKPLFVKLITVRFPRAEINRLYDYLRGQGYERDSEGLYLRTLSNKALGLEEVLAGLEVFGNKAKQQLYIPIEPEEFSAQLQVLIGGEALIEAAKDIHRFFLSDEVELVDDNGIRFCPSFIAMSNFYKLLDRQGGSETGFFKKAQLDRKLDEYLKQQDQKSEANLVLNGLVRLMEEPRCDGKTLVTEKVGMELHSNARHWFTENRHFQVKQDNRVTAIYLVDSEKAIVDINNLVSKFGAHPILILYRNEDTREELEKGMQKYPSGVRNIFYWPVKNIIGNLLMKLGAAGLGRQGEANFYRLGIDEYQITDIAYGNIMTLSKRLDKDFDSHIERLADQGFLLRPIVYPAGSINAASQAIQLLAGKYRQMYLEAATTGKAFSIQAAQWDQQLDQAVEYMKKNIYGKQAKGMICLQLFQEDGGVVVVKPNEFPIAFAALLSSLKVKRSISELAKEFYTDVPKHDCKMEVILEQAVLFLVNFGLAVREDDKFRRVTKGDYQKQIEEARNWANIKLKEHISQITVMMKHHGGLLNTRAKQISDRLKKAEEILANINWETLNHMNIQGKEWQEYAAVLVKKLSELERSLKWVLDKEGYDNFILPPDYEQKIGNISNQPVWYSAILLVKYIQKVIEQLDEIKVEAMKVNNNWMQEIKDDKFPLPKHLLDIMLYQIEEAINPKETTVTGSPLHYLTAGDFQGLKRQIKLLVDTVHNVDQFYKDYIPRWRQEAACIKELGLTFADFKDFVAGREGTVSRLNEFASIDKKHKAFYPNLQAELESRIEDQDTLEVLIEWLKGEIQRIEGMAKNATDSIKANKNQLLNDVESMVSDIDLEVVGFLYPSSPPVRPTERIRKSKKMVEAEKVVNQFNQELVNKGDEKFSTFSTANYQFFKDLYHEVRIKHNGAYMNQMQSQYPQAIQELIDNHLLKQEITFVSRV